MALTVTHAQTGLLTVQGVARAFLTVQGAIGQTVFGFLLNEGNGLILTESGVPLLF